MSFADLLSRAWKENILFSAMVELTYRCNLDCFFCYNDLGLLGTPLTTEEYFRLFDELREMEVLHLVLTGGEPLAHPDFFTLGARARELGFAVRIKSNGHALRGRLAERVKREIDPLVVDLSLHGARPATHDRQTRVPGSFERLVANLGELTELGLRLKLNATLTRWNEGEVEEMFALADSLGVPLAINPTVAPRDDGDREPLAIAPSREGKRRLFEILAARAAAQERPTSGAEMGRQADDAVFTPPEKNCGAGSSTLTIDPYGNVLPCVQWRRPVGNVRQRSLREIWNGSAALDEAREISSRAHHMVEAQGSAGRRMGFCMGLAELASGDPLATYPIAREQAEILGEVAEKAGEEAETRRPSPLRVIG